MKHALETALAAKGYDTLTEVQQAVSAEELDGRDLLVSAQTGSGKTLGFGLAIASRLFGEAEHFGPAAAPLALVIAPTRELALQVKRELGWLYAEAGAVLASTVGGMDMRDERRALSRGAHIVVATPGRLRDHIMRGSIDLSELRAVVLDEADEMLDLGFREDLEFILDEAPEDRQTLLFSATVPAAIAKLAQNYQRDAVRVATTGGTRQHADISYRALSVAATDAENAIINVLRYHEADNAIVFCNTRAMVGRLTTRLSNRGFSVVALSGELSQSERSHALQAMRDGRARVCVATDVAARGIDLPNLELVIHAELPTGSDTLLHRSGRTGRAGRKGISALIVPPASRKKAQRLLGWAKLEAEWGEAPSADAVRERDDARMMERSDWTDPVEEGHADTVAALTARFTPEQLAAAYVRLYRANRSAPEELSDPTVREKPRAPFGPSRWFSLEGGRAARAEPRRLLPMICKMGGLSREDIGAIRIQEKTSLIEIREAAVPGFLDKVGPGMTLEEGAALTALDAAPSFERGGYVGKPGGSKAGGAKSGGSNKPARKAWQDDRPPAAKPSPAKPGTDTPETAKPAAARPAEAKSARPPATPPTDWNDAPSPKPRKPKPGATPSGKAGKAGKPGKPGYDAKPHRKGGPAKGASGAPHTGKPTPRAEPAKPRRNADPSQRIEAPGEAKAKAGKPRHKPGGKFNADGPKGPPPPKGKPSSKKNRARQADRKAALKSGGKAGRDAGRPGGLEPPRKPRNG